MNSKSIQEISDVIALDIMRIDMFEAGAISKKIETHLKANFLDLLEGYVDHSERVYNRWAEKVATLRYQSDEWYTATAKLAVAKIKKKTANRVYSTLKRDQKHHDLLAFVRERLGEQALTDFYNTYNHGHTVDTEPSTGGTLA